MEVKRWIRSCDQWHECRSSLQSGSQVPKLLVIDVFEDCLAALTQSAPYLALSYVWGRRKTFYLTRSNHSTLLSKGALRHNWDKIPCTIRDAIVLTARLGFRYLWVDQLCIVQDDEENKSKHIQQMYSIYANASITIVAADGEHADHGLKGIRGGSGGPRSPQEILDFSPLGKIIMSPTSLEYCEKPMYFSRGWTYQEYHLSNRLLVFIGDKVIWRCQELEWQEGHLDPEDRPYAGFLPVPDLYSQFQWPDLWKYLPLVEEYNARNLGHDADILSAFTGVLVAINPAFPGGFLQGLPEFYFDLALLWQPAGPLRRRVAGEGQSPPPSWSWVGWEGKLDLDLCENGLAKPCIRLAEAKPKTYDMIVSPLTKWYRMEDPFEVQIQVMNAYYGYYELRVPNFAGSKKIDLADSDFLTRITNRDSGIHGLPLTDWTLSARHYHNEFLQSVSPNFCWPCYSHTSISELKEVSYPLPIGENQVPLQSSNLRYLHFRSYRAHFTIGRPLSRLKENKPIECISVHITDQEGTIAGILRLNSVEIPYTESTECELIAISKGKAHLRGIGPSYILEEASDMDSLTQLVALGGGPKYFDTDPLEENTADQVLRNSIGIYEWYNVLWIETRDGIAYRKALGRVFKDSWEAQAPECVEITLG